MLAHFAVLALLVGGGFLAWRWPRALWPHLGLVGWGGSTLLVHQSCPLTSLEDWARRRAGGPGLDHGGFIDTYLTGALYPARDVAMVRLLVAAVIAISWMGTLLRQHQRHTAGGSRVPVS